MSTPRRSFLPFALIALGAVFLLGNLIPGPGRGGLIVLGIGVAFLIGRLTTGRYGYSVPAGILIGIGTYVSLRDILGPQAPGSGGWFFICLGLGFALTYVIGMRPTAFWPLFPAVVLSCLGLLLFGFTMLGPLASMAWIVGYWPVVLVLVGAWLVFRDHVPLPARQPLAMLGGLALLAYGVLAAASTVAAGGAFVASGFGTGFGLTPYSDTVALEQALAPGATFTVANPNGRTTIRAASGDTVRVEATRHFSVAGQPPEVTLVPDGRALRLQLGDLGRGPFGSRNRVDFDIFVPATAAIDASAASGNLEIDGISASVHAEASSGSLKLTNIGGAADVKVSSGSVTLENVTGEVTATASSGDLRGTRLQRVRQATTSSGDITLEAVFTGATEVRTSSGDVDLKLLPGSTTQIDASSRSGRISQRGLSLAQPDRRSLTATLGSPSTGAVLSIQTASGDVELTQ